MLLPSRRSCRSSALRRVTPTSTLALPMPTSKSPAERKATSTPINSVASRSQSVCRAGRFNRHASRCAHGDSLAPGLCVASQRAAAICRSRRAAADCCSSPPTRSSSRVLRFAAAKASAASTRETNSVLVRTPTIRRHLRAAPRRATAASRVAPCAMIFAISGS